MTFEGNFTYLIKKIVKTELLRSEFLESTLNMARANLNKSTRVLFFTTTASKTALQTSKNNGRVLQACNFFKINLF